MPVPTDRLYTPKTLNWWFALSCVLLVLSMVATLWDDYAKAWRKHQQTAKAWQVAMARQKVEQARFYKEQPEIQDRITQVEKALNDANEAFE